MIFLTENDSVNNADVVSASQKHFNLPVESFSFIRKGVAGSHKKEISPEYEKKFDEWIRENLKNSDFKFVEVGPK